MAKQPNTLDNYFSKKTKTDIADEGQVIEQTSVTHSEDENPAPAPISAPLQF